MNALLLRTTTVRLGASEKLRYAGQAARSIDPCRSAMLHLDPDSCCFPSMDLQDDETWRRNNIGRLLNNAVTQFEERVFQLLAEQGHSEVPLVYLHLTRNLDRAGTRMTELARRAAMTKQAMSEIVLHCEAIGLVRRVADPTDARAKIVLFTDEGLVWLHAFKAALENAEAEMCDKLGKVEMKLLKETLARYEMEYQRARSG